MKFVNVREFKMRTTAYLRAGEELVITRYGKPYGVTIRLD